MIISLMVFIVGELTEKLLDQLRQRCMSPSSRITALVEEVLQLSIQL